MDNPKLRPFRTASCKKHPNHHQSPGVCSLCLKERLSNISGSSSQAISNVSSSSCSSISSVSSVSSSRRSSNVVSPMQNHQNGRKTYDHHVEGKGYLSFLRKSRSMAFVGEKILENDAKKKKGDGFWSKLIGLKRSKTRQRSKEEGPSKLMHSRTMREMLTTRV